MASTRIYAYVPPEADGSALKNLAGIVLYGGVLALVVLALRLTRRSVAF